MTKSAEGKALRVIMLTVLATPFLVAFGAIAGSFPIMLALGVWHHEIDPRVPALGYWPTVLLSWGLGSMVTKFRAKYNFGKTGKSDD